MCVAFKKTLFVQTKKQKKVFEVKPKAKAIRHFKVEIIEKFDDYFSDLSISQCYRLTGRVSKKLTLILFILEKSSLSNFITLSFSTFSFESHKPTKK